MPVAFLVLFAVLTKCITLTCIPSLQGSENTKTDVDVYEFILFTAESTRDVKGLFTDVAQRTGVGMAPGLAGSHVHFVGFELMLCASPWT